MDKTEKEQFWAELDALGEKPVREKLGLGLYGDRRKTYVIEWLRQIDQDNLDNIKTPWHQTSWGIALITLTVGVVLAGFVYYLGWN